MKTKFKLNLSLKDFVGMVIACAICAASIYYIMVPASLVVGGVAGLALVVSNFVPIGVSTITMIINVGLLLLGYLLIGPEFGIKTVMTSVMIPAFMGVCEHITPEPTPLTDDLFINAIAYLICVCIGQAMLFNMNASSGGLDIVGKLINKYLHLDLGTSMIFAGFAASATSVLVYDRKIVVVGLLATFFTGPVLDYYLAGFNIRKKVCIVSDKWEEVRNYILDELIRGATIYEVVGAFDNRSRKEINVILEPGEHAKLLEALKRIDPNAFITSYTVGELHGLFADKQAQRNAAHNSRKN